MNRLAAIQDWPLFCTLAVTATLGGPVQVGRRHHTNGSLPPIQYRELTHREIEATAGRPLAARSASRRHPCVPQHALHLAERSAGSGSSRPGSTAPVQVLQVQRGLRDVRGVLEQPHVPAISAGAAERTTCHSGEVPTAITASTTPSGW